MRYLAVVIFGLLMLPFCFGHATSTAEATPPQVGVIRVWKVGSPHTGKSPETAFSPALQVEAEKLGYRIEVEPFKAEGFAAKFWKAMDQHDEPEVIAFDNYGVLVGIQTALGRFQGIVSDPRVSASLVMVHESLASLQERGWVMLVASARHYEAARALAQRPLSCNLTRATINGLGEDDLRLVKETLTSAAHSYLTCNTLGLSQVSDKARMGNQCFLPNGFVNGLNVCSVSGNQKLIFASLVSSFSAERPPLALSGGNATTWRPVMDLGHQSLLAILRRSDGEWGVLAITDDPLNVDPSLTLKMPRFEHLLSNVPASDAVTPAQLVTADQTFPKPAPGQRFGDFLWRPSSSPDLVGQVAEFTMGGDRDLTRLFFLSESDHQLSTGRLMGVQWRWRVWSVAKDGAVAFSEQRSSRMAIGK